MMRRFSFMMCTVFGATGMIFVMSAMLHTHLIFCAWMFRTMFCTVVFCQRLAITMLDTGFAFFTFMLGTMFDAIVTISGQLLMITMFWLLGLYCRRDYGFTFWSLWG
jgi:hypothetical protein